MSAGEFLRTTYESNLELKFPMRVQPETIGLTIGGTANSPVTDDPSTGLPSASVSRGRRANGVNARLVRFKFSSTLPPGYLQGSVLTLPVLQQGVWEGYSRGKTGTYTLNGTAYDIEYIGKTPEAIV